ncbi:MAG: DUF2845 domain-containing protein [Xanthomonadales bacterium]|nr:DUF2845 domain-containing protein [Xanthomonadales bacterium]
MKQSFVVLLLFVLLPATAWPDGFRCGTRLVVSGDPVSRLLRACGTPALKYRASETVRRGGKSQKKPVQHWVYERAGRPSMIVAVSDGKVLRIHRE